MLRLFARPRQTETRGGVLDRRRSFADVGEDSREGFLVLRDGRSGCSRRCDRLLTIGMFEKDRPRPDFADEPGGTSSRAISARCQGLSVQVSIGAPILAPRWISGTMSSR